MLLSKNQSLNVAIVGNNNCGKTRLINYWTETDPNTNTNSNTNSNSNLNLNLINSIGEQISKSMIIEINSEFINLNIYKISSTVLSNRKIMNAINQKIFHAIIYLYDLYSEPTKNNIPDWTTYFKNKIKPGTYQIILGMGKDDVLLESDEVNTIREYYMENNIDYYRSSFNSNEHLSNLLNNISIKSFICMKQRFKLIETKKNIEPEYIYIGCCIIL